MIELLSGCLLGLTAGGLIAIVAACRAYDRGCGRGYYDGLIDASRRRERL